MPINEVETQDILLISMPFCDEYMPCMTYAMFKAMLAKEGIRSKVLHEYLYYAAFIGKGKYRRIMQVATIGYGHDYFACETVFANEAHESTVRPFEEYIRWMKEEHLPGKVFSGNQKQDTYESLDMLCEARDLAGRYLDEAVERVRRYRPKVVAFTSMFQQHNAMIALARRLKRLEDAPIIIAGGPNCHGEAGAALIEKISAFDYVFTGEADEIFAPFCKRLIEEGIVPDNELPPGILSRTKTVNLPAPVTADLDSLPIPDFSDYYEEKDKLFPEHKGNCIITVEGSRGCWWAAKHPCRFCGLNGSSAHLYREKSVERFAQELAELSAVYPQAQCYLTDNVLSLSHQKRLPGALLDKETYKSNGLRLFSEIKSSTSEEDISGLADCGFFFVQAGIETFSDEILGLMNKGVKAITQIQTLKHCRAHGIKVLWYVLVGTPGETEEMCREVNRIIPKIMHLDPPDTVAHIMFLRHSDYMENGGKDVPELAPDPGYDYVYPDPDFIYRTAHLFSPEDPEKRATFYDYRRLGPAYEELFRLTESWTSKPQLLLMKDKGSLVKILDTRHITGQTFYHLEGVNAEVIRMCRNVKKEKDILSQLQDRFDNEEIKQSLSYLTEESLLVKIGDEYLTLAVDNDSVKSKK